MKIKEDWELIKVEKIPQVSFDTMNKTHIEEVILLNNLYSICKQEDNDNTDKISNLLAEWVDHTYMHFDNENKLMEKHLFPAKLIHQQEHSLIIGQLEELKNLWKQTQDSNHLIEYLEIKWLRWFSQHVSTMDAATANFINMQEN